MKSFLSLLFATSLVFTSCKKEAETQNTTPTNVVPFTEVGRQMKTETATASPQQNTTAQPTTESAGANPAHGQPGHRCDIAVGAPLNSPVAATTQTTPQQTATAPAPTVTSTAVPVETTPTPEGMNPPHGQTNHRCDIAVGAPLPK
ncbi:hypothetical protein [Flavobacterium sandaracinum]|uniref:Uncharacterized protein n=1 Tax=Flavobacterium sandaracinum TaxID=2541733 RepID=A0A4R5D5I1_9FLAO|nr:hypothetical protein [Flavobacterium sandaracinum]TDE07100.1 hypothetical protein E0F91_02085 [Flavobacterium sandaracinum]